MPDGMYPKEELIMKQNRRLGLLVAIFCIVALFIATAAATGLGQVKFPGKSLVAGNRTDTGTHPSGPPPGGVIPNGTAPCGPPPDGVMPNSTHPSGAPPGGVMPNGTAPCGPPPEGVIPNDTPPSWTQPSAPVPSGLAVPSI